MKHSNKNIPGPETSKAIRNFPPTQESVSEHWLKSIVIIKHAAAKTNRKLNLLDTKTADAIEYSCKKITSDKLYKTVALPTLQGGAGTSINMYINELIAVNASTKSGTSINSLDQVNLNQSTNDVLPSALRITINSLIPDLLFNLDGLISSILLQASKNKNSLRISRTHLQDAVPSTYFEYFTSVAETLTRDKQRLAETMKYFSEVTLGGGAIGNGFLITKKFTEIICKELSALTQFKLKPAQNSMSLTSSVSDFIHLHAIISVLFTDLAKFASDLRILSSGPRAGLSEVYLPEMQQGSSIMAGKVNPVIPELINQYEMIVNSNHNAIVSAANQSQLDLPVFFPVIATKLIESIQLSISGLLKFKEKCTDIMIVNNERSENLLTHSSAFGLILARELGHSLAAEIIKEANSSDKTIIQVLEQKGIMTTSEFEILLKKYL